MSTALFWWRQQEHWATLSGTCHSCISARRVSGKRNHTNDVIKWKHFPRYWPFVRGIHWSPVNSPHKGLWRGALVLFYDQRLSKRLSKQSWGWWFETPSCPLWRHCNDKANQKYRWFWWQKVDTHIYQSNLDTKIDMKITEIANFDMEYHVETVYLDTVGNCAACILDVVWGVYDIMCYLLMAK